ncbi:MAG: phage holin family protein [Cryomorphaceae bacterium]|nr:phage holin family protein [Flavobacteriales bacterium]
MNILNKIEALTDDLKRYFATNVELLKLQTIDKSSEIGAGIVSRIIVWTVGIFALIFLSVCCALYLSSVFGAYYLGFGAVGGFYLLVFLILLIGRKSVLETPIRNNIISKSTEEGDLEDTENF